MAEQPVRQYSLADFTIQFGTISVSAFGGDSGGVTVEYTSDGFTSAAGPDGQVTRSKSGDRRGKITFKLSYGSPSLALLQAQYQRDLDTPGAVGVVPIAVRDRLNGTTAHEGSQAWIMSPPKSIEYGAEAPTIEIAVEVAELRTTF